MARYTIGPAFGLTLTVAAPGISVNWGSWEGDLGLGAGNSGQFPDNCHTIIIENTDAANTLLVGSDVLELGAAVTQGFRVPPSGTMTLAIGNLYNRVKQRGKSNFPAQSNGFVFDAVGGAVTANVTFVCGIES